jgi:hypothetical protein
VGIRVGVIPSRNPLSKRYSAMEVGEVGIAKQPHTVEAQRHAQTAYGRGVMQMILSTCNPHLPHPTPNKALKQAEIARWGSET